MSALLDERAVYNIFRWYRAGWGRYTQSDPLNLGTLMGGTFPEWFGVPSARRAAKARAYEPQREHAFAYALNRPIAAGDPRGLNAAVIEWGGKVCQLPNPWMKVIGGTAIAAGVIMMAAPSIRDDIGYLLDGKKCTICTDDKEHCDAQLSKDLDLCWEWWGAKGAWTEHFACKGAAMQRYAECLKDGQPHSPLSPNPGQI